MATRLDSTMRGFLVPDPRLGCDDLAINDASAAGSAYSQVNPRPGSSTTLDPLSRIVPFILGGLEQSVEIDVVSAGDPGTDPGSARFRWRFEGEAATDWRGYTDPVWSTLWSPVSWTQNAEEAGTGFAATVHPETQSLVVVRRDRLAVPQEIRAIRCSTLYHFGDVGLVEEGPAPLAVGLVALPSGRLLCVTSVATSGAVLYSDDVGSTWSPYSADPFVGGLPLPTPHPRSLVATRDGVVLMMLDHLNGEFSQYVSRNLGATFEAVEANVALGYEPSVCIVPDGRIVLCYLNAGGEPRSRTVASPFDPFSDAQSVDAANGTTITSHTTATAACDGRGVVWFFSSQPTGAVRAYRSTDAGTTWHFYQWGPLLGSANRQIQNLRAVAARGFVWLFHRPFDLTGPGLRNDAIGVFRLGGWSNLEPFLSDSDAQAQQGWIDFSGEAFTRTWFPASEPSFSGWVHNGTTNGTVTGTPAYGHTSMMIDCAIGANGFYSVSAPEGALSVYAATSIGDPPGNPPGGNANATYSGIRVTTSAAALDCIVEVRIFGGVRFRLHDAVAAADLFLAPPGDPRAPPPMQLGGEPFAEYYLTVDSPLLATPTVTMYYRRADDVTWARVGPFNLSTQAGGLNGEVAFGNITVADVSSGRTIGLWRAVNVRGDLFGGIDPGIPAGQFGDIVGQRGIEVGTSALELVSVGELGVDEGRLAVRGGPGRLAEVHTIQPIHDFPISSLFWDCSPSRSEVWRSTDDQTEQILAFAFSEQTRIGGSFLLSLFVAGANFPTARLEVDTVGGGLGWTTVATLNLCEGFESLGFERIGDTLRPGAAPLNEGGRFLNRAELVGGVARWGSGGSAGTAHIQAQSAGGWTDKTTNTIQPFVRVDPAAVGGTSSGANNLDLQAPAGLVVAHVSEADGLIYGVRVAIEAADTPDGYHEAGLLMVGAVTPFGQQWSRGYSVDTRPNATRTTSSSGTIRKTELGKPAARFGVAWPDGVKLHAMRAGIDVDYLGPAGKPPAVAKDDVWGQLWGLLDETKSGELPVVIVTRVPDDDVTMTDRTLFAFATLDGSARFDHVLGDEGESEFGRVSGIVAQEIK